MSKTPIIRWKLVKTSRGTVAVREEMPTAAAQSTDERNSVVRKERA